MALVISTSSTSGIFKTNVMFAVNGILKVFIAFCKEPYLWLGS